MELKTTAWSHRFKETIGFEIMQLFAIISEPDAYFTSPIFGLNPLAKTRSFEDS